jgi:hypothetical protein
MIRPVVLISCAALLTLASASYGGDEKQPFIGVLLDTEPLPDLLTKHLGLDSGQGLRIVNVSAGSSADRATLERDDIIIAFRGEKTTGVDQFIEAVQKAGVGAKVSLDVIHLGQRRTVEFELESGQKAEWKYPSEPEAVVSWRPGKVFKIGPDGQKIEIPIDMMPEVDVNVAPILKQVFTYEYTTDSEKYVITIQGDPTDDSSKVTVRAGETEHSATVGDLDRLPEEYRPAAKEALASARANWRTVQIRGELRVPDLPQLEVYQKYLEELAKPDVDQLFLDKDRALKMLQDQMKLVQERVKQLEEQNHELLDRLLNKKDQTEPESDHTQGPAPSGPDDKSGT